MVALVIESWIWYGFVILVGGSRFVSRHVVLGGFKRYQLDDWCMLAVLCFYTTLIATINIVAHTSSNLFPPGYDIAHLTAQDIRTREYGSKLTLVVEQSACIVIFGTKACLLILYLRLTTMRKENIAIKVLAVCVGLGFVFMEIMYFAVWCRPFSNYWAVPTPNVQCDAATNHLITNATLNISSDIAMLAIGLPMFIRMQLPWRKKVPLIGIFSLGVFVVLAAILNKVYSFSQPFGDLWPYWYVRESSTALLVANLPFVWTVWRKITGLKTSIDNITARSRADSILPGGPVSPKASRRKSSSGLSLADLPKAAGSSGDVAHLGLGVGKRKGGELSLADMLGEGYTAQDEKEATPITHPHLFYNKPRRPSETRKIQYEDSPPAPAAQWSSSPREASDETPASPVFPQSWKSEKSAISFV